MTVPTQTSRTVAGVINSVETLEGAGFLVRRPFPKSSFSEFDPFLLLDELGPINLKPGQAKGAPDHPHRGFETVSYVLDGRLEHKDSAGHAGLLNPGDVQWMTAGAGVVHSEMPKSMFTRTGGRLHGIQLWVNLPQRDKMMPPHYQEIPAAHIPVAQTEDRSVTVRVIAGEALGAKAVIQTRTPITCLVQRISSIGESNETIYLVYFPVPHARSLFDGDRAWIPKSAFGSSNQPVHQCRSILPCLSPQYLPILA